MLRRTGGRSAALEERSCDLEVGGALRWRSGLVTLRGKGRFA